MTGEPIDAPGIAPRPLHQRVSHWLGFLVSGGLAFTIDAGMLALLTRIADLDPFTARFLAIASAMVVGWLAHRRLTFAVARAPSLKEFLAYAALQWTSVAANYLVYAGILLLRPGTEPLVAMIVASLVAMVVSYLGMRFGVFARH